MIKWYDISCATLYDLGDHVARVGRRSRAYGGFDGGKIGDLVVRCVANITVEVGWRGVWTGFMWLMMGKSG